MVLMQFLNSPDLPPEVSTKWSRSVWNLFLIHPKLSQKLSNRPEWSWIQSGSTQSSSRWRIYLLPWVFLQWIVCIDLISYLISDYSDLIIDHSAVVFLPIRPKFSRSSSRNVQNRCDQGPKTCQSRSRNITNHPDQSHKMSQTTPIKDPKLPKSP